MAFIDFLKSIQGFDGKGSRSSVLSGFFWMFSSLISLTIGTFFLNLPLILQFFLMGMVSILFFFILGSAIYFYKKNPDYLRSEKFHFQKIALETIGEKEKEFKDLDSNIELKALEGNEK